MKDTITVEKEISRTVKVNGGNITANVRMEGETVTSVDNGVVTDANGVVTATFSQYQGSGLNVSFATPYTDEIATLGTIRQFIDDVTE